MQSQSSGRSHKDSIEIALQLHNAGRFTEAETIYQNVLACNPDSAEAHKNYGNTLLSLERLYDAEQAYRQALALDPDYGEALNNLGNILSRHDGRMEEAEEAFRRSLVLLPGSAEVHSNFGNLLMKLGRFEEAEQVYRKAIILKPDSAMVYNNRGNALRALNRWGVAEKSYQKAITLKPDFAEAYRGLGDVFMDQLLLEEAEQAYQHALVVKPDSEISQFNLSLLKLLQGNYEEGFELYEKRFNDTQEIICVKNLKVLIRNQGDDYRLWQGEAVDGNTLSILTEQGAGDSLMMMRYLALLKQRGLKRLIVYCIPSLRRIFQSFPDVDQVVSDNGPLPCGLYCPLMSLPHLFKTRLETAHEMVPYLNLPNTMKLKWRSELSNITDKKVGLVWAGGKATSTDKSRSIPLAEFASLREIKGVHYISLQKGEETRQLQELDWNFIDKMDECED